MSNTAHEERNNYLLRSGRKSPHRSTRVASSPAAGARAGAGGEGGNKNLILEEIPHSFGWAISE